MPRPIRAYETGDILHVVTRGNRKAPIFHSEDDFAAFNDRLKVVKKELPFALYAYCQMTNHCHFLIRLLKAGISEIMHLLLSWHAKYYNERYEQVGHVFQGRFKSSQITNDGYFLEALRYIHLNPVYAGITSDPADWKWSGHGEYLNGTADLIDSDTVFPMLSVSKERQGKRYLQFLRNGLSRERRILHPGIPDDARIGSLRLQVFDEVARRLGTAELPSRSRQWRSMTRRLMALRARQEGLSPDSIASALGCSKCAYENLLRRAGTQHEVPGTSCWVMGEDRASAQAAH